MESPPEVISMNGRRRFPRLRRVVAALALASAVTAVGLLSTAPQEASDLSLGILVCAATALVAVQAAPVTLDTDGDDATDVLGEYDEDGDLKPMLSLRAIGGTFAHSGPEGDAVWLIDDHVDGIVDDGDAGLES